MEEDDDKIFEDSDCPVGDRCVLCPKDATGNPVCLVDCGYNDYINDLGECTDCVGCTAGCYREENCNTCVDPLCDICNDFEQCETCVANASKNAETG
jgi:hypothetical protein